VKEEVVSVVGKRLGVTRRLVAIPTKDVDEVLQGRGLEVVGRDRATQFHGAA
jgi:hypothetical protein